MNQIDPGTPTWLRARNDRTAFRLLLEHGPLTRARLGELSGMSKPTAAQMLARLDTAYFVSAELHGAQVGLGHAGQALGQRRIGLHQLIEVVGLLAAAQPVIGRHRQ